MTIPQLTLILAALTLSAPVNAQQDASAGETSQAATTTKGGWPAVSLIGMPVLIEGGEKIGSVTDVLVQDSGIASIKIDVSQALGQGRSVTIEFSEIELANDRSAPGRVSRFAPTDRTGGARLTDPDLSSTLSPPAASVPTTRAAANRTVDVEVPASIGAEPGSARRNDPRGADSMADVRSRSADSKYVGSMPRVGIWGGPSSGLIRLSREELLKRSDRQ